MITMTQSVQKCIQDCMDCARSCKETTVHCLEMGGKHAEAQHIATLMDCGEICATSADFMMRRSDFSDRMCQMCAEVCLRCAEECERFGDDAHMRACAEMCRRCADSCREMAGMRH